MKYVEFDKLNGGKVFVSSNQIFVKLLDSSAVVIRAEKDITGIPYLSVVEVLSATGD